MRGAELDCETQWWFALIGDASVQLSGLPLWNVAGVTVAVPDCQVNVSAEVLFSHRVG